MYRKFIKYRKCLASFLIVNLFLSNFVVKANNGPDGTPNNENPPNPTSTVDQPVNNNGNSADVVPKPGQNPLGNSPTGLQDGNTNVDSITQPAQSGNKTGICPENDNEMVDCEITLPDNKKYNISKQRMIHIVYGEEYTTGGGHTKKSIEYRKNMGTRFEIKEDTKPGIYTIKKLEKERDNLTEEKSIFPDKWGVEKIISAIGFCLQNYVNEKDQEGGRKELICSYKGTCICVICEGKEIITAFPLNKDDDYYIDQSLTEDIYAGADVYKIGEDGDKFKSWDCNITANSEFAMNDPFSSENHVNRNIWCAVTKNHLNLLDSLINKHSSYDVNNKNSKGETLLYRAVSLGNKDIAKKLFEKGFKINNLNSEEKEALLRLAVENGDVYTAEALIDNGVSNPKKESLWIISVKNGYEDMSNMLIRKGAIIENLNFDEKKNFLSIAIEKEKVEIAKSLIESIKRESPESRTEEEVKGYLETSIKTKNKAMLEMLSKEYNDIYGNIKGFLLSVAIDNDKRESSTYELADFLLKEVNDVTTAGGTFFKPVSPENVMFIKIENASMLNLLIKKLFLNIINSEGDNYLHYFLRKGKINSRFLPAILGENLDRNELERVISAQGKNGENILHIAARQDDSANIMCLLSIVKRQGLTTALNIKNKYRCTILHILACYNKESAVEFLIQNFNNNEIKTNELDNMYMTPGFIAVLCGYNEIATMIDSWKVAESEEENANITVGDLGDLFEIEAA